MANWSFNPFTGNLDISGSGAVVFEGEVATFADLPVTVGEPAVGASYLVRESTGVWLVNRKQAGIWIRKNNTGVRDTDWEYGGDYPVNSVNGKTGNIVLSASDVGAPPTTRTISAGTGLTGGGDLSANRTLSVSYGSATPSALGTASAGASNDVSRADHVHSAEVSDSAFRVTGSTDATKKVAIEVDTNVPTGQTVTLTAPSASGTLALAGAAPAAHAASHAIAGIKAAFSGQVDGMTSNVSFRAIKGGTIGNSIVFSFDGSNDIQSAFESWNDNNPNNQAEHLSGDLSQVPDNGQTITLSGGAAGADLIFDQDVNTTNNVAFNKLTLTPNLSDSSLKLGTLEFQSYALNNAWIGDNVYFDGANFKRRTGGAATLFYFQGEEGQFRCDTSNNAGTTVTSAPAFKVGAGGKFSAGANVSNAGDFENGMLYSNGNNIGFSDKTDNSKKVTLDLSGISEETTRSLALPNASGTIALTSDIPAAFNPASPGAIGGTTPAAITGTVITANTTLALPASVSGSPAAGHIYRNADTLRYRDSTNTERTLLSGAGNLANLTDTATARTNIGLGSASSVTFGDIQNTPIGSTTRNSGAFTTLSANNGTLTASAPVLDLEQTWNNAAVAFTGMRLNCVQTANSTSSSYFTISRTGTPVFQIVAQSPNIPLIEIGAGGFITRIRGRTAAGVGLNFDGAVGVGGSLQFGVGTTTGAGDVILARDSAANTLAQVNGTNAQTFRLYNTSANSNADFERGFMRWNTNVLQIGTEAGGTGSGARAIMFVTNGTNRWAIGGGGGSLVAQGAFPMETTGYIRAGEGATAGYQIGNGSFVRLLSSSAGILLLTQAEGTSDFGRLQFGGTTSSFPALKRSSTTLQVRLADDSAFAPFECAGLTLNGNLTASTRNIVTDTTTGTRIGTGTTQLLGFWNAAPSAQPAAVADATDAASTQARLNDLLARLRTIGIIAT